MRNPLLPITAAFAAGIWAAPHFYLYASEQLLFLALIVFATALLLRLERYSHGLVLALGGFFLCGTFLAGVEHWDLPPQHVASLARRGLFRPEQPSELIGWSRTPTVKRPGSEYFDLEVTEVRQSNRSIPARGAVRVYYFPNNNPVRTLSLAYGTPLSLPVRDLRRPRNFLTPGAFDWEAYTRRRGIYFSGLIRDPQEVKVLPGHRGTRWRSLLHHLRGRLLAQLDRLYPAAKDSSDRAAILKAMLLGDDNWLRPDTEMAFQQSGTYHILVVSGVNVTLLAAALFAMLFWLRLPNWVSTLVVGGCVVVFTFLADAGIPVVRATLMTSIYLVARLIYRDRALLNSIAAAALLLLLVHPSDLRDGSFQLSFLAVLILAAVALPIIQWTLSPYRLALQGLDEQDRDLHLEPRQAQFRQDMRVLLDYLADPSRLGQKRWQYFRSALAKAASGVLLLAEAIVFTSFMQLGFALVMASYFHRVVWSGIAGNLMVLPLTGLLIPAGFLVLLASLLWWPAGVVGGWVLGVLVSLLHGVAAWSAGLVWLNRRVPTPPITVSLCFAALLVLITVLVARRSRWTWAAGAALGALGAVLTVAPYTRQWNPGQLEFTTLDVGQGDSLILSFPRGTTVLIDGGGASPDPDAPFPRLDLGENVVSPYLWSRRLKVLDIVVLTHAHLEHLGGLRSVLQNFRVGELWVGPGPESENLGRLVQLAAERGVRGVRQQSGTERQIDGVQVQVLSPPADWNPQEVSNDDSLVLRLGYGRRHLLLPGDIEARMERRLMKDGSPLASDVLKVSHHGSKSSTTAPFLSRVAPSFGVISVGAYRRFGHPHDEVLETLRSANVRTYRTDADGSVTISTDGNRIELTTFRETVRPWPPFRLRTLDHFPVVRK